MDLNFVAVEEEDQATLVSVVLVVDLVNDHDLAITFLACLALECLKVVPDFKVETTMDRHFKEMYCSNLLQLFPSDRTRTGTPKGIAT